MPESVVTLVSRWCWRVQGLQTIVWEGCFIDQDVLTVISNTPSFGSFQRVPVILRLLDLAPPTSRRNLRQAVHLHNSGPTWMNLNGDIPESHDIRALK